MIPAGWRFSRIDDRSIEVHCPTFSTPLVLSLDVSSRHLLAFYNLAVDLQAARAGDGKARERFEAWLKLNPDARFWNTTDAMFAAFLGGAAAPAVSAPAAHLDLFAEKREWSLVTGGVVEGDVVSLLGWLTGAVNGHLERAIQAPSPPLVPLG